MQFKGLKFFGFPPDTEGALGIFHGHTAYSYASNADIRANCGATMGGGGGHEPIRASDSKQYPNDNFFHSTCNLTNP